jgi:hypothetical protein
MATLNGQALPKKEAQLALAKAVGNRFRATGDSHYTVSAFPTNSQTAIAVSAYFPDQPEGQRTLVVLVPVTLAGWNTHVEQQLVHEFLTVCEKRVELEKFCLDFIAARVKGVADAYR